MEIVKADIDRLRGLIGSDPQKIIIVSHTNPDGDAIGSSLAWGAMLEKKGHDVTYVVPNRYPSFLEWMHDVAKINIYKNDSDGSVAKKIEQADIIFCMDFNNLSRLEALGESISANKTAKLILIDHHLNPPDEYFISFSYPKSCSTSFLVYELIRQMEGLDAITKDMSEALYVGIMTDTGNFSFSFLTAELFVAIADLVRKGIDIPHINSMVYNSFTTDRVHLLGYALNKMEIMRFGETGLAYITLTEEELRKFNFQPGDSEGFVNFPLTIGNITMSVIFISTRSFIRISFRSQGDVNVSEFAKLYFEGGGHKNASGGKSFRSMPDTIEYFKACATEYFR